MQQNAPCHKSEKFLKNFMNCARILPIWNKAIFFSFFKPEENDNELTNENEFHSGWGEIIDNKEVITEPEVFFEAEDKFE